MFAGGFPDEMEVFYMIKMRQIDHMPGTFYIYMVCFVIVAVGFTIF